MNRIRTNLYIRNKTYYCRIFIPRELQYKFGKKEIWKSLKTSNYNEAKARLYNVLGSFDKNIDIRGIELVNDLPLKSQNNTPLIQNDITIEELIDGYNKSPEIAKKGKSIKQRVKPYQRLILGFLGSKTKLSELNRGNAKEYYSTLERIPKHLLKSPIILTRETIERVIRRGKHGEPITNETARGYWNHYRAILDWAINENIYPITANYTYGLNIESGSTTIRLPFDISDLNLLFSNNGILKYKDSDKKWFYWMCLLSFFTGARAGEIVQLKTNDIGCSDDIYYISINRKNSKDTKNKGSIRKIPLHSKLIELGFIEYYKSVKNRDSLFPSYKKSKGKNPSDNYSNEFADLVRLLGVYDNVKNHESGKRTVKTLHSFRHTLNDFTYKLDDKIIREIFGWTGKEMREYYGSNEKISILDKKEELEKVTFKGIKFLDEL